jgi:hypothetical protein
MQNPSHSTFCERPQNRNMRGGLKIQLLAASHWLLALNV